MDAQGKGNMPGGNREVTPEDSERVEKAKKFLEQDLRSQIEGEDSKHAYITRLQFSEYKVTRQVVRGILYNFRFKLTRVYDCVNDPRSNRLCVQKAPEAETWKASVWFEPYSDSPKYGTGKQPTKVEDSSCS